MAPWILLALASGLLATGDAVSGVTACLCVIVAMFSMFHGDDDDADDADADD
jgi:hypothetical protein